MTNPATKNEPHEFVEWRGYTVCGFRIERDASCGQPRDAAIHRLPTADEPHEFQYANVSNGLCWCGNARGSAIHRAPSGTDAERTAKFEQDFDDWQKDMEASIEATRRSEILSAKDYAVTINATADAPASGTPAERDEGSESMVHDLDIDLPSEAQDAPPERVWIDNTHLLVKASDGGCSLYVSRIESGASLGIQHSDQYVLASTAEGLAEALRVFFDASWLWTAYHINVEEGNYLQCRFCRAESPGGFVAVSKIEHAPHCVIIASRTALARWEGKQ